MSVIIEGIDDLNRKFRNLEKIQETFDPVVKRVAADFLNNLVNTTPVDDMSGLQHTKNMWEIKELGPSLYSVDNKKTTQDGKIPIAQLLNDGRKEVRPKRAKKLYIPISRKAKNRNKALGAPIPKDLIRNEDYVLADKAKAVPGTKFIDNAEQKAQINLREEIGKKIRSMFK